MILWRGLRWSSTHTHTHSDLSQVLNITVRLALNPEVHAKRRSSSLFSLPLKDKKKRGALEFSPALLSTARCLGFAATKTTQLCSASALLSLNACL